MVIDSIPPALDLLLSWPTFPLLMIGLIFGIYIGGLPGIGPSVGIALAIPLTIGLEPHAAIILMLAIYCGGSYGSCIAAILVNTPGTSAAAATTLDGYPMSKQGRARDALSISAIVSALGGIISTTLLIIMVPFLMFAVLAFTSPERALVAILGILMVTVVARGALLKGLIVGMFGFLISTVGVSQAGGDYRYIFDTMVLFDGLHFVAILLGVFAITEMIKLSGRKQISTEDIKLTGSSYDGFIIVYRNKLHTLKSALIGMGAGIIPGSGGTLGTFMSYSEAVRAYGKDGRFGEGDERGVIASETADNAAVAGSLIPTLSLGIPGSGSTAVLLGGLILHGLTPGPSLFSGEELILTMAILISMIIGNIVILFAGLLVARGGGFITEFDTNLIIPIVVVFCMIGTYILRRNWIDVVSLVVFGLLGYYMVKYNYSVIAFVLGVILGPIVENNYLRSLNIGEGSHIIFVQRPLSIALVILIILILIGPLFQDKIDRVNPSSS